MAAGTRDACGGVEWVQRVMATTDRLLQAADRGKPATELGEEPLRAEATGLNAATALAGISGGASQRVRVLAFLRLVPGVGEARVADDAPNAYRRRADVCG